MVDDLSEYDMLNEPKKSIWHSILPSVLTFGSIIGLLVLGWFAYQEGRSPTNPDETPIVRSESRPAKVAPVDPGGMEIPDRERQVFKALNGEENSGETPFAVITEPEEPIDPNQLSKLPAPFLADTESAGTTLARLVQKLPEDDEKAVPTETAGTAVAPEAIMATQAAIELAKTTPKASINAEARVPDDPTKPTIVAENYATETASPSLKTEVADSVEKSVKEAAEKKENFVVVPVKEVVKEVPKSAPAMPKPASMKSKVPEKAAAVTKPLEAAGAGDAMVQLGSFRTEQEVSKTWPIVSQKFSSDLSGLSYRAKKVNIPGKGEYYRLLAGPVSKQEAQRICKVLSASNQGCLVAKP